MTKKKLTTKTADEMYLNLLELTDLPFGDPVYMSDGMYILPDGTIFDDSEDSDD